MIAVKVFKCKQILSSEKRLWQGRLQEFSVDFFYPSAAVIYWGKEVKRSSSRKDLLFAWIWIHKEGFRACTDAGNRANRLAITKVDWREKLFEGLRALTSKYVHVFACVFMLGSICGLSYPRTPLTALFESGLAHKSHTHAHMCCKPSLHARPCKPIWLLLAPFFATPSQLNPLDLMPTSASLLTAIQSYPSPVPIPFRPKSFSLSHYYSSPRCCDRLIAQTTAPLKCHFWIISFFLGCLRYSMCRFHLQMSWLLLPDAPTDWSLSTIIPLKAALILTHAWLCPSLLPRCWHPWDLQKTMGSLQIIVLGLNCLLLFYCH